MSRFHRPARTSEVDAAIRSLDNQVARYRNLIRHTRHDATWAERTAPLRAALDQCLDMRYALNPVDRDSDHEQARTILKELAA